MAGIANGGKKPSWFGLSDGTKDISVASDFNPGKSSQKKRSGKGHITKYSTHLRFKNIYK